MLDLTTTVQEWSISQKYSRRDADFARLEALAEASAAIGKKYWSSMTEIWNLELIVTDRPYRRRGAATALVKWGTVKADQEGIYCRVEASPMGKPVYMSCGFKELGTWDVQVKGQSATLHMWCMGRAPERREKESDIYHGKVKFCSSSIPYKVDCCMPWTSNEDAARRYRLDKNRR
jgi:hypothetical protein